MILEVEDVFSITGRGTVALVRLVGHGKLNLHDDVKFGDRILNVRGIEKTSSDLYRAGIVFGNQIKREDLPVGTVLEIIEKGENNESLQS